MKALVNRIHRMLDRHSPDAARHFRAMLDELGVARIHRAGVRRCKQLHRNASGLRINFGSGAATKSGFLNLDFSPAADIRLDLRRPIPLPDGCAVLVHSEHFVEHLAYPEGVEGFFAECLRILAPGGELSISVPDTDWPMQQYASGSGEWIEACRENRWHPQECSTFMEHLDYHFRQRQRGVSYDDFNVHRFAWDFETMAKKLREAGFVDAAKRPFNPDLDCIHRRVGSLFVSARRP
ncbi:MAG TPA: methyltransferase domain-containing protein [Luteolibacter sp.]|nr:methyltransferase domain-containing protein [Luteolibacter sp.]